MGCFLAYKSPVWLEEEEYGYAMGGCSRGFSDRTEYSLRFRDFEASLMTSRQAQLLGKTLPSEKEATRGTPETSGSVSGDGPTLSPLYRELLKTQGQLKQEVHQRTISLATLAHELKKPLAIISGYIELLLEQKVGALTERQRKILEATNANCLRLQRLTHDFLSYSALQAGGRSFPVTFEMGNLNSCLSEVCGYWMPKFAAKGVALFFESNPQIPPFPFDIYKVEQVIANLIENALRFTGRGGSVWITAEPHAWERRHRETPQPVSERRKGNPGGPMPCV